MIGSTKERKKENYEIIKDGSSHAPTERDEKEE